MNAISKKLIRTENMKLPIGEAVTLENGRPAIRVKNGKHTDTISLEKLIRQTLESTKK